MMMVVGVVGIVSESRPTMIALLDACSEEEGKSRENNNIGCN